VNVSDAIYHAVHDYKGGAVALAPRMGLAVSTLENMANPNLPSHEFNLRRLDQLLTFTEDYRPLDALCAKHGGVFVRTAGFKGIADDALLETLGRLGKEFGDVCGSMNAALADGRVTEKECASFEREVYELTQAAHELVARLRALVEKRPALKTVAPAAA
jgi:hypothetical protein